MLEPAIYTIGNHRETLAYETALELARLFHLDVPLGTFREMELVSTKINGHRRLLLLYLVLSWLT